MTAAAHGRAPLEVSLVVPTLGTSPLLGASVEALLAELAALPREGGGGELVLVHQGADEPPPLPEAPGGTGLRVLRLPGNLGFAGGVNRGLAAARGRRLGVVNDDLVVEPGWLAALLAGLEADPLAASVQGWNRSLDDPERVDGGGLGWNASWQAVQLGHGRRLADVEAEESGAAGAPASVEIFGVSATAALYRREALESVRLPGGALFDEALESYYEDVDLAARLRGAGWRALRVPRARARHAGSLTGRRLGRRRIALLYGNRHLVLARMLGGAYARHASRALARDVRDLAADLAAGRFDRALGVLRGWARAWRRRSAYRHAGTPVPSGTAGAEERR